MHQSYAPCCMSATVFRKCHAVRSRRIAGSESTVQYSDQVWRLPPRLERFGKNVPVLDTAAGCDWETGRGSQFAGIRQFLEDYMRKIMLAATAIAALGLAGAANAQTSVPDATPNFGLPIVPGGAALDAGTVNVFVKGKVYTSASVGSDSGSSGAGNGGAKLNSVDLMSMMRLYFGFDGKSNQGLGYGANIEVRQFYDGQYANGSAADPLQVRREFVYFGTDAAGKVRMGTVDGPFGLMEVGNFAWAPYDVMTGFLGDQNAYGRTKATLLNWSWGGNSNEYMTNKITYQTPTFAGFDFGASFEPNFQSGTGYCAAGLSSGAVAAPAYAAAGSNNSTAQCYSATTASSTLGKYGYRENSVEAIARYKGAFGPVAVALELGTWQSGVVKGPTAPASGAVKHGLGEYIFGGQISSNGFAVLANYETGNMNPASYNPQANGTKKAQSLQTGVSYTTGHLIVGGSLINEQSNPDVRFGQLHEIGYNVGATYDFAPGAAVFLSGLYGTRHEGGFNLLTSAAGTVHNTVQVRSLDIGTVFNF